MSKKSHSEIREKKENNLLKIVHTKRNELISNGLYPETFSMPLHIQFELTSRCNLKCKHCYNVSGKNNSVDKMTPQAWEALCYQIVSQGGIFQATFSGGEPLLLGDTLFNMMDILNDDGTVLSLLTNGILVNKEIINKLKKYNMYWVQISLDSPTPSIHDNFRGVNGSWDKAARSAYLIANSGIPVRIASSITKESIGNIENFIKMAINLGASYLAIGEIMPSGTAFCDESLFLSIEERSNFESEVLSLQKKYRENINISISGSQKTQLKYASLGTVEGAIVRPNGSVRLDCSCPFVIGNVTEHNLFEIWREKSNAWSNPIVQKYINSCDFESGKSSFIKNFIDEDILI